MGEIYTLLMATILWKVNNNHDLKKIGAVNFLLPLHNVVFTEIFS